MRTAPHRINHCISGKCWAECVPPETYISYSLLGALSWNRLSSGCLGRELLATETTNASRLNGDRQAPFAVIWHMAWGCEIMHVSKCNGSQRHPTAWRYPAVSSGTLPKWSFHFWSILNPLLLSACPSPSFPPFLATLDSACSLREIGQT